MKNAGSPLGIKPMPTDLSHQCSLHWATTTRQPSGFHNPLYILCTSGIECFSHASGSHYVCIYRGLWSADGCLVSVSFALSCRRSHDLAEVRFACILNKQWISMCSLWNCELWIWKGCSRQEANKKVTM